MRHKRYLHKLDAKGKPVDPSKISPELDTPHVVPSALRKYLVTATRVLGTGGRIQVLVEARSETAAREAILKGEVQGIGLGWQIVSVVAQ